MRKIYITTLIFFISFLISIQGFSQIIKSITTFDRKVAILNTTVRNSETSEAELFSAEHILKVSGIPYIVTDSVSTATQYAMLITSSYLSSSTLNSTEKILIQNYVDSGGILIVPYVKDSYFYSLFGISSNLSSSTHYTIKWDTQNNDSSLIWLNDTMEQTISLGDTSYSTVINTRSYTANGATPLAYFNDSTIAVTKNQYGSGYTYALGFSFKNLILLNQINHDYEAQRINSNGFEPTSDAIILFIKGIYTKHIPFATSIHTCPYNSKSVLVITHDVDCTSSMNMMNSYADFEDSLGISTTYFVTTRYIHDLLLSGFYNSTNIPKVITLVSKNQKIASHSVGHFPDFDDTLAFPIGSPGNTMNNYSPYNYNNGTLTTGGSLFGELEVSKYLLETNIGVQIKSFRAGHLLYNNHLVNILDSTGYKYNTSHSAPDVLTNFPYQNHYDRLTYGKISNVFEIPLTLSDVFSSDTISALNYNSKVALWKDVIMKNRDNCAINVLLIHPNRWYKIFAERNLINQLPQDVTVIDFDSFGDYWAYRDTLTFSSSLVNSTLTITIPNIYLPLNNKLSFIVNKGQLLSNIIVQDESNNVIQFQQANWGVNSKILYLMTYPNLGQKHLSDDNVKIKCNNYPNPFKENTNITFTLNKNSYVKLDIFDIVGNNIENLLNNNLSKGDYQIKFNARNLKSGIYFYKLSVDNEKIVKKMIICK